MSESMTTTVGAMISVDDVTGWVQLVRLEKEEDGWRYFGGYSIRFNSRGEIVSQSPVQWNCRISLQPQ